MRTHSHAAISASHAAEPILTTEPRSAIDLG